METHVDHHIIISHRFKFYSTWLHILTCYIITYILTYLDIHYPDTGAYPYLCVTSLGPGGQDGNYVITLSPPLPLPTRLRTLPWSSEREKKTVTSGIRTRDLRRTYHCTTHVTPRTPDVLFKVRENISVNTDILAWNISVSRDILGIKYLC